MALTNQQRVARKCVRATGTTPEHARRLAATGLITKTQPVPDAASSAQRSLEAFTAHHLADELRNEQLVGAVLGFTAANPRPDGLDLIAHPQMLRAVIANLLPHSRPQEREHVYGVPGLRPRRTGRGLLLEQIHTGASLRILNANPAIWQPDYEDGVIAIWRKHPDRLINSEKQLLSMWSRPTRRVQPEDRNLLFSRFLRRPGILREIGKDHSDVNSYTHSFKDIVLEWCCGPTAEEFAEDLRRNGIEEAPPDVAFELGERRGRHVIELGTGVVTLRQNCLCDGIDGCLGCRRRQELKPFGPPMHPARPR